MGDTEDDFHLRPAQLLAATPATETTMTTTNNSPIASIIPREETQRTSSVSREQLLSGMAFVTVVGGLTTLAWAVSSGYLYGVTIGDALTATFAGHALVLGTALRMGGK